MVHSRLFQNKVRTSTATLAVYELSTNLTTVKKTIPESG